MHYPPKFFYLFLFHFSEFKFLSAYYLTQFTNDIHVDYFLVTEDLPVNRIFKVVLIHYVYWFLIYKHPHDVSNFLENLLEIKKIYIYSWIFFCNSKNVFKKEIIKYSSSWLQKLYKNNKKNSFTYQIVLTIGTSMQGFL